MQIKYKGCDISHHQGKVDFTRLKSQVDFVIIKLGGSDKTGGTCYIDNRFEEYYKGCKVNNIPVGCYWFAGKKSTGIERGLAEAEYVYKLVKNRKFDMPIYLDFEMGNTINKKSNTDFCTRFCDYLEKRNLFIGIYASDVNGFKEQLNDNMLVNYSHWVARYGKQPQYVTSWGMWQYTSKGKLNGINGNVDLDYAVSNFPKIIKNKHMNGW